MFISDRPGIPREAISRFAERLEKQNLNMHGFLLTIGGRTAAEKYWAPFSAEKPHRMFSVSKSFTALAVGILSDRGLIGLDEPVCGYFPEYQTADERIRRAAVRDLLRMTSCHSGTTYKQTNDGDWTRTHFTLPSTHEPGMAFCYDTSASHVLAALVQKLSGRTLLQFLKENLFDRIGADGEKHWMTDPSGVCQGGSGLVLTLRDLSKTANLCLRGGDGIISREFLASATKKQIETPFQPNPEERFGYGYQFWITRNGGFAMYGVGGQYAVCLPEQEMVLCTAGDLLDDPRSVEKIFDALFGELYPYALKPGRSGIIGQEPERMSVRPLPDDASAGEPLHGQWRLEPNAQGWTEVSLDGGHISLKNPKGPFSFDFALGEMAYGTLTGMKEPYMACGARLGHDRLLLKLWLTGDMMCSLSLLVCRSGRRLTVQAFPSDCYVLPVIPDWLNGEACV